MVNRDRVCHIESVHRLNFFRCNLEYQYKSIQGECQGMIPFEIPVRLVSI